MTDALPETIHISNIGQFAAIMVGWHGKKMKILDQLAAIPDGAEFQVGDGPEAKKVVLTGAALDGFRFGVQLAQMELGTLPFAAELEPAGAANDGG